MSAPILPQRSDVTVSAPGTVYLSQLLTKTARDWVDCHVSEDRQTLGGRSASNTAMSRILWTVCTPMAPRDRREVFSARAVYAPLDDVEANDLGDTRGSRNQSGHSVPEASTPARDGVIVSQTPSRY